MKVYEEKGVSVPGFGNIYKYTIENSNGFKVGIINCGAAITEIISPDSEGRFENVVLGYADIVDYLENPVYMGCVVGRTAGRISKGCFALNGIEYNLDKNSGENNLHGGASGISRKLWDVDGVKDGLILSCRSRHLEGGFPAEVEFRVRYTVTDENSLKIEYLAIPDRETLINMTNHSYFNLSGNMRSGGEKQLLRIGADAFCRVDENTLPTGEIVPVAGGNFDFRKLRRIEDGLKKLECDHDLKIAKGYDHPFLLNPETPQINLFSQESGRQLEMETDQRVVVFYSGNYLEETINLSGGRASKRNLGICLETQDYPDAVNVSRFPVEIYSPEKIYRSKNEWKFSVRK